MTIRPWLDKKNELLPVMEKAARTPLVCSRISRACC